ncbi:hypothetical protein COU20_01295 [Candidatus Kaiserbacteria bacterium CG10_big_fil_rev_8_21_14_0_10_59_10]|uniref:histidine kinase n=1 Tax=Candidatus Kaiserbacteria bacterium CG10_big_fil_rev_8_21_14_0_10_59_10 TaxID=1974612 RepID=A0A2H0U8G9_9BACT|nr:MAG: hypothetical protein COU20_01295 [Candidatus Kaiserbacteria bacterium CG10_big_fil_rev_8_21_14_0_10_59_10]
MGMREWACAQLPLSRKELFFAGVTFAAYFFAAKLGLYLYYAFETSPALIWPPVGIALAAVLLGGHKMWLPILLAQHLALISHFTGVHTISLVIASAYALQAVAALYLLRRFGFDMAMTSARSAMTFVGVVIAATVIEPAIATAWQLYSGTLGVSPLVNLGRAWGGGVFSALIVAPLVLVWYRGWRTALAEIAARRAELALAFATLAGVVYAVFWTPHTRVLGATVIFMLPAALLWFVLRFNPRLLALAVFVSAVGGIAGTIITLPGAGSLSAQLLNVQVYIGLIAALFIVFAAVEEERRQGFRKLRELYAQASAADRAKSEFIAILAHELRNPLAPIVSSLDLLRMQPQTAESAEAIHRAEQHTIMIRRLLDGLLDTARLSQGKFVLRKELVRLQDIVDQSVASVEDYVRTRRHTLRVIQPEEPVMLYADAVRVKQILINLLTNACKYTPPCGYVELYAEARDGHVLIRVSDTGEGISSAARPRLYTPFSQVHEAPERGTGLGIGLFLTKRLVEMHNGKIQADSDGPGQGSTFSVYLPLSMEGARRYREDAPAPAAAQPEAVAGGSR